MKSLEIVNKKINYCEEQEVPCVSMRLVSLQEIKQDLEILKILRKHLKNQELHFMEDTPRIIQWLEENRYEKEN
jgi:hypothetical protein